MPPQFLKRGLACQHLRVEFSRKGIVVVEPARRHVSPAFVF